MPRKQKKEGVQLEEKRIPSTVATQFLDMIDRPFWSLKDSASASDDFFDCYVAFKEFGCHEYIWQWQDRKLDQLLVKKLIHAYGPFFKDNPIGSKRFITFSVSSDDAVQTLGRLYMSIIDTNVFAEQNRFHAPPLFEVLHTGESSDNLVRFSRLYNETVSMATDGLGRDCSPKTISVVPTHNFDTNWYPKLHQYLSSYQSSFRTKVEHLRPLIPRSAVADRLGFVASTLATKRALASYSSFEGITGTTTYPIVDAGPLLFRGGMNPSRIKEFIAEYPGARSVTITPAFRYSYDLEDAKSAIAELNRTLPRAKHATYSQDEVKRMVQIEHIFSKRYNDTVALMPDLSDIPSELEAINRPVNSKLQTSFSLYSLGVPPEMIGTGTALLECIKEGIIKDLEHAYPSIKSDLITAGSLLNRENLSFLAKTHKVWAMIEKDVQLIEDYTGASLGPTSTDSFLHRNHTSNVFHLRSTKQ
ncbi:phosphoenolpyruvate carboxylase, partial [Candidatus Woesearchaeota archaeon]|nr:phosphoenolpyruvate carboxylase [Candidatus Woesearchaeota archaeon]